MKKILRNIDKKLLIFTILLFIYGLIMVFSSSNVSAFMRYKYDNPASFFIRQALFLASGVFIFLFIIRFPTKHYGFWSWLGVIIVSVVLVLLLVYGQAVNETVGWIGYKGFGIQPSELAKVLVIPFFATYYDAKKNKLNDLKTIMLPVAIGIILTLLVVLQNDFGTASIIAFIVAFMFLISNVEKPIKRNVVIFTIITFLSIIIILITSGTSILSSDKLDRFNFFNPCDRYITSGNQVCNGYIAINNSNGIGRGLGDSTQKYLYLAESHTDFIYAILIEELGIGGMILLFALYFIVLARIYNIAKSSYNNRNAMLAYGVLFYIFIHIIVNLFGVLGLMPLTGVTLPFISYGGSFTWSLIFALTMVQRVKYETSIEEKRKKTQKN